MAVINFPDNRKRRFLEKTKCRISIAGMELTMKRWAHLK